MFFDKGEPTRKIWYYQLNPRPKPRQDQSTQRGRPRRVRRVPEDGEGFSTNPVDASTIDQETTFDLSVKNPNAPKKHHQGEARILRQHRELTQRTAVIPVDPGAVATTGWETAVGEG